MNTYYILLKKQQNTFEILKRVNPRNARSQIFSFCYFLLKLYSSIMFGEKKTNLKMQDGKTINFLVLHTQAQC